MAKAAKKSVKKTAKKAGKKSAKKSAKKSVGKKPAKNAAAAKRRKVSSKRELIDTGVDKRFVRRSGDGQFKESDDVGRSLAADIRQHAQTDAPSGQGDKGD